MDQAQSDMTPEERLRNGLCPECAQDLSLGDPTHHSLQHWPEFIRPDGRNAEAMRRQQLLADWITANPRAKKGEREDKHKDSPASKPYAPPNPAPAPKKD